MSPTFKHKESKNPHKTVLQNLRIAKTWKPPKCPSTGEWIKKVWCIYSMEYYSAIKKEGNFALCNNMDGLGGHFAK